MPQPGVGDGAAVCKETARSQQVPASQCPDDVKLQPSCPSPGTESDVKLQPGCAPWYHYLIFLLWSGVSSGSMYGGSGLWNDGSGSAKALTVGCGQQLNPQPPWAGGASEAMLMA
ncbi:hypothetical protein HaLaN_24154 [Haematococcus lacustris]|uniref:Uncharacterized protein n=1 Tax=Haematococcus lacustris TaxID=44745 RepID=A0A6A0A113_HAELA|nr:hypothetical protein HaLaN_24154 [Haematococcus lacustris]